MSSYEGLKSKVRTVAATANLDVSLHFSKQLQQYIGTLMGQMKSLPAAFQAAKSYNLNNQSR